MAGRPFLVRQLIEESGFEVELVGGAAGLDRECRGVSIGEHLDPTPWMACGSIHLTAGLALAGSADGEEGVRLLQRLAAAGMAGLGLSVPHYLDEIPAAMRVAADQLGLPLFAVTGATLFRDIERYVYDMLASDELQRLRRSVSAQQQLLEIVAGEAAPAALTAHLAVLLAATVLLLDAGGAVLAAAAPGGDEPPDPAVRAARAWSVYLTARDGATRAPFAVDGQAVVWREIVVAGRVRMVLLAIVDPPRAQDDFVAATLTYARRLLEVDLGRRLPSVGAADARLLREVLAPGGARVCAGRLALDGFGAGNPFRLAVVRPLASAGSEPRAAGDVAAQPAAAACAALLGRRGRRFLLLPLTAGGCVLLVEERSGERADALAEDLAGAAAAAADEACVVGLSDASVDLERAPDACAQALQAAAAAGDGGGRQALTFAALGPRRAMLARLGDADLERLAARLAPLHTAGADGAARLKQSLACYLGHDCSLSATAEELGLHRNTLGKRLARCERLLGAALATVGDLVDVQLALDAEHVLWSRRATAAL